MIEEILNDAKHRMQKAVELLENELKKLRTGRAHPSILGHIRVNYYGTETPLDQMASITASDSRTLTITPWDKSVVGAIEKAIMTSGLGLNPATAGTVIRVPMPPLTEERRRDLVKVVKSEGENTKVAIRNVRRDAMSDIKELLKAKEISEDDEKRAHDRVQKVTDEYIAKVETVIVAKENDLMEI